MMYGKQLFRFFGTRMWLIAVALGLVIGLIPVVRAAAENGPLDGPMDGPVGGGEEAIAYVDLATGDQIRLVQPDGSNNRLLWTHGQTDTQGEFGIWSLAWRADATEVAFASTHEQWCSTNYSDVYAVGVEGQGYRRVTEAPACGALSAFPQGTVHIPVQNNSIFNEQVDALIYFQGAPAPQEVSLPPGASDVVIFENVADMGGVVQFAVEIQGNQRMVHASSGVDVRSGETVQTSTVYLPGGATIGHEVRWPTWRAGGDLIGYVHGFNSVLGIAPHPAPLTPGDPLLTASSSEMPDFVNHLAYGPPGVRENQFLYASYEAFDSTAIYLATEGGNGPGQALVTYDATSFVHFITGLAWLPDGSGFVYAVLADDFYTPVNSNIYVYRFASGQSTQVTAYDDLFVGQLSVSPDGEQIVFERGEQWSADALRVIDPQLWIVNVDGSGERLLAASGRAPAWSPQALPAAPVLDQHNFLPYFVGGG